MVPLLIAAIPAYFLLIAVEAASFRREWRERRDQHSADEHWGYESKDTRTSLAMGLGSVVLDLIWKLGWIAAMAWLYDDLAPWHADMSQWWSWLLVFLLVDFLYYWDHRFHHRVRFGWASHVVHHSSQHFNLSTALRQTWTPVTSYLFFLPAALAGFPPAAIVTVYAINLLYQFWIHTERIGRLPGWFEAIFNTPSHHRVHHGADHEYLDKNYAGVLIIWDRMFASFVSERERPAYGLTTNINTFHPFRVAFHEWVAMFGDAARAPGLRNKIGYLVGPPGWRPSEPELPRGDQRPAPAAAPNRRNASS